MRRRKLKDVIAGKRPRTKWPVLTQKVCFILVPRLAIAPAPCKEFAMKDQMDNVRMVCQNCSRPDSRYFGMPLDWFVGRAVQIVFEEHGIRENMWVEVIGTRGDALLGFLDNDPVAIEGVECGDPV